MRLRLPVPVCEVFRGRPSKHMSIQPKVDERHPVPSIHWSLLKRMRSEMIATELSSQILHATEGGLLEEQAKKTQRYNYT